MPDMSIRLVAAAGVQDVFGRGASQLGNIPLALTADMTLAVIWL